MQLLTIARHIAQSPSSLRGLYIIVVKNCVTISILIALKGGRQLTFFLYRVVALVAKTPFLILVVARWLSTV